MNKGESASGEKGNHFRRYLNYAASLLENYKGHEPLHLYLKKYFSANKKHGSKDRKIISSLCYDYFRLGFGVSIDLVLTEKLLLGTFLAENNSSALLEKLKPDWNKRISEKILTKIHSVKAVFDSSTIFPFKEELSDEIDFIKFNLSFLIQPKLFVRIRPGKEKIVLQKLKNANFFLEELSKNCLAFSNNERISDTLSIDKEVVIQDYNSQRTGDLLKGHVDGEESNISVWDCCAASGGKSILAKDIFKNIELTVSDRRKNILQNLQLRFEKAGIKNYTSFTADLSVFKPLKEIRKSFDIIIADVPCSGSGTWARTPEQLSFFNKREIIRYAQLQQKIVVNTLPYLKENGFLLYVTCSVFKKENEENVSLIQQETGLQLIKSEYLKGYEIQADTLFVTLFKNKNKNLSG